MEHVSSDPSHLTACQRAKLAKQVSCFVLRRNLIYNIDDLSPHVERQHSKFVTARQAIECIKDNSAIALTGLGACHNATILLQALSQVYKETSSPKDLTFMVCGGTGTRGRAKGSVDELAKNRGQIKMFITAHLETYKHIKGKGMKGEIEIHCIPQGIMCMLFENMGNEHVNYFAIPDHYYKNTMMDPDCGGESGVTEKKTTNFLKKDAENQMLRFSLPYVDCAIINASAADTTGNIFNEEGCMIADAVNIAKAAKQNGGLVIALVSRIVEFPESKNMNVLISASYIDKIVVDVNTEQCFGATHQNNFSFLSLKSIMNRKQALQRINDIANYNSRYNSSNAENNNGSDGNEHHHHNDDDNHHHHHHNHSNRNSKESIYELRKKYDEIIERKKTNALRKVRYLNALTFGGVRKRSNEDLSIVRLGASIIIPLMKKNSLIQIGTGLAEELVVILHEKNVLKNLVATVESGCYGGIPCPGALFGSSIYPDEIVSASESFNRVYKYGLDCVAVGALEVDSYGNVNVTRLRGEKTVDNFIGPGGFIDLTINARVVAFFSSFMAKAEFKILPNATKDDCNNKYIMKIQKPGDPCFVDRVFDISFNGQEALKRGQQVYYFTHVGVFRLTPEGMELTHIMPGMDIHADILPHTTMQFLVKSSSLLTISDNILTGLNFALQSPGLSRL